MRSNIELEFEIVGQNGIGIEVIYTIQYSTVQKGARTVR